MYIPLQSRSPANAAGAALAPASPAGWGFSLPNADASSRGGSQALSGVGFAFRAVAEFFTHQGSGSLSSGHDLRRRDGVQDQNTTIGVIVGVLLAVFLIAVVFFLYRYRFTIQFSYKKKHRPRSGSSKSSKTSASSASSDGGAAPAG